MLILYIYNKYIKFFFTRIIDLTMVVKNIKSILANKCAMNKTQINLTLLSMFTIMSQGLGFYLINPDKMNSRLFIFVLIFGFIYNILFYKTYVN
jgi:hypothetical protein